MFHFQSSSSHKFYLLNLRFKISSPKSLSKPLETRHGTFAIVVQVQYPAYRVFTFCNCLQWIIRMQSPGTRARRTQGEAVLGEEGSPCAEQSSLFVAAETLTSLSPLSPCLHFGWALPICRIYIGYNAKITTETI